MSWGAVAGAAIGVVGGAMSKKKDGGSQTTTNEIDPRFAPYIYGSEDGKNKGLLSDAFDWYDKNKSGMNDQMRQGLNTQWSVLNDPKTMGGYQQMSSLGSGLMGAPVVGNPFADGRTSLNAGPSMGGGNLGVGGQGAQGAPQAFQSYGMPTTPQQSAGAGPFTAPPPPAVVAPPPEVAPAPTGWEDLFNPHKTPGTTPAAGTSWAWNGGMWQPQRYETGGA
jgi:hypothetical protein